MPISTHPHNRSLYYKLIRDLLSISYKIKKPLSYKIKNKSYDTHKINNNTQKFKKILKAPNITQQAINPSEYKAPYNDFGDTRATNTQQDAQQSPNIIYMIPSMTPSMTSSEMQSPAPHRVEKNRSAYTGYDETGGGNDIDINYIEQLAENAEDSAENAEESEQNANQ